MSGKYDFTIEQGANFHRVIEWRDENNTLVNLTSYTATLQARPTKNATPVLDLSVGNGLTLGGSAGTITIDITNDQTAILDFDSVPYNLELTSATGSRTRLLKGYVTLDSEVDV